MSARIQAQTGAAIRACTFHSLGLEICRSSTIANRPIIDENVANKAIKAAFDQLLATSIPYRLLAFKLMPKHLGEKYAAAARLENFRLPVKDYDFNQYAQHLVDTAKTIIQQMRSNNINVDGMRALNRQLREGLKAFPEVVINSPENAIPHILNLSVENVKGTVFQRELDAEGVCVSVKSACSSDGLPSRAVFAVSHDRRNALSSWRISLSHLTTEQEITDFMQAFDACYNALTQ